MIKYFYSTHRLKFNRYRVDLGVISKAPELEPQENMQLSIVPKTLSIYGTLKGTTTRVRVDMGVKTMK